MALNDSSRLLPDESAESNNVVEQKKSLWDDSDGRQKLLLLYLAVINILSMICATVPTSFLARVVVSKHGTPLQSTVMLHSNIVILSLTIVVFGKFQPAIGCKLLLLGGLGLLGFSQIAFGFVERIANVGAFIATGTVLRGLLGFGQGVVAVSGTTIVCQEYPQHIWKTYGLKEVGIGIGYIVGMAFGGALYDVGGMLLPLVVSGGAMLLMLPVCPFLLRTYSAANVLSEEQFPVRKLFWNSKALILLFGIFSLSGGFGLCNSILTNYVKSRKFSVTSAGVVLLTISFSHCLGGTVSKSVTGTRDWLRRLLMTVGFAGFALMGLIYTKDQTETWIYVGSALFGLFSGFAWMLSTDEILLACERGTDIEDLIALEKAASGYLLLSLNLSTFVLSLVGSALQELLKAFSLALVITVCIGYSSGLIFAGTIFVIKKCTYKDT